MASGNIFMGDGHGKLGSVVFSRKNGKQNSRMRNSRPRNPQTEKQMVSRLCLKVLNKIYSALSPICGHSFEGCTGEAQNRAEFMRLNLPILQKSAANFLNTGSNSPLVFWPSFKEEWPLVGAEFIISQGTLLHSLSLNISTENGKVYPFLLSVNPYFHSTAYAEFDGTSYSTFAKSCGLNVGDQITFVSMKTSSFLGGSSSLYMLRNIETHRVILSPSSGDPNTTPFWDKTGSINLPNERNTRGFAFRLFENHLDNPLACDYIAPSNIGFQSLMGVIVSRKVNGKWLRSSSSFLWSPYCAAAASEGSDIQTPYPFSSLLEEFTAHATIESEQYLDNATK